MKYEIELKSSGYLGWYWDVSEVFDPARPPRDPGKCRGGGLVSGWSLTPRRAKRKAINEVAKREALVDAEIKVIV